jgi:hypothetical protein
MEKTDSYIFISYSRANQQIAREIYDTLSSSRFNLTCWLDIFDIKKDDKTFQQQIVNGIQNASCLLLVETQESKKSPYVHLEVNSAELNNVPIIHYRVNENKKARISLWDSFWLAQRINFRVSQPFWVSIVLLIAVLLIMASSIFYFGSQVSPVLANTYNSYYRNTPQVTPIPTSTPTIVPIETDPKKLAPFHFSPKQISYSDDFLSNVPLNEDDYRHNGFPITDISNIIQQDGLLKFHFKNSCTSGDNFGVCVLNVDSKQIPFNSIQYFGFRARRLQQSKYLSFSLFIGKSLSWDTWTGFGWFLTDSVSPYFQANQYLPESDFYTNVNIDNNWHVYEITLDPNSHLLTYYVDGQLIGTHELVQYENWKDAPLNVKFYSTVSNPLDTETSLIEPDTDIEIDQIIVGSFQ